MIYCVEDEENIRDLIVYALNNSNYNAQGFGSGTLLFEAMKIQSPNLIILDIMLPGEDGIEILKKIRSTPTYANIPVILLTAKSEEMDKIAGLDKGADDYITKPFSVLELLARIKALFRRVDINEKITERIEIDGVEIDNSKRTVTVGEKQLELTYKEFELLLYLFRNENIVLTRDKILSEVWGYDFEGESRTVDVHVASLRQKLGDKQYLVKTVRNIGYKVG